MEFPAPPADPESKTLIEKLAVFVARNGHEFEKLTRSKQRHNPRFSFLFGGKHSDYYQCRLAAEKTGPTQQRGYLAAPQQQQTYALPWQQRGPPAAPQLSPQREPASIQRGYGLQQPPALLQGCPEQQPQRPTGYPQPPQTQLPPQQSQRPTGYPQPPQTQLPPQQPVSVARLQSLLPSHNNPLTPDTELAELARQMGMPADKLTSVLEQLLPSSAPAAVTPEKLLTAFVMKRLQAEAAAPAVLATPAATAPAAVAPAAASVASFTAPVVSTATSPAPVAPTPGTATPAAPASGTPTPRAVVAAPETSAAAQDAAAASQNVAAAQPDAASINSATAPAREGCVDTEPSLQQSAAASTPAAAPTTTDEDIPKAESDGQPDVKRPRLNGTGDSEPASVTRTDPAVPNTPPAQTAGTETVTAGTETVTAGTETVTVPPAAGPAAAADTRRGADEIAALKKTVRDPDALFALSVAEALKRLPMEGKATLKIAIMEVVAELRPCEPAAGSADAGEEEFSEAFFIGEDAAEVVRAREAEQEPPPAPPVKRQCVPKTAPFSDQLADAKARAAAIAREAAEQSRAAQELQRQNPPLSAGYGPPPAAGYAGSGPPAAGYAGSGPPAAGYAGSGSPAAGYAGSGPPVAGYAGSGPPAAGYAGSGPPAAGYAGNGPPAAGYAGSGPPAAGYAGSGPPARAEGAAQSQWLSQPPPAGPPTIQPIRPLMAGAAPPLTPEQIQQQIQLLQQLSAQQQQRPSPVDQVALQLQAAAVMGVEPRQQKWDQPPQAGQQGDAGRPEQQPRDPWGRTLPAPSASMPRDAVQRGGPDRRYRSPPRRHRR